jgi:transglutaminase-like putative cysteine protease
MGYRLTWVAAGSGIVLAILRMGRLLRDTSQGPPWQLVLAAALLLGGMITWVAVSYRLRTITLVLANIAGLLLATLRIAAPDTALFGVFPTSDTIGEVFRELGFAMELIRFGTAPIIPVAGIILMLTWIFWSIGAVGVWALTTGRGIIAVIPGMVLYLQLATMDRVPPGRTWLIVAMAVLIGSLAAVAVDERLMGSGRARAGRDRFLPAATPTTPILFMAAILVVTVFTSGFLTSRVPDGGVLNWRTRTGFGNGIFGGVSYNLFVGIQQDLVSQSDQPVFTARVTSGDIRGDELYWKLIALEEFDGENFFPRRSVITRPTEDPSTWELADQQFHGPTETVTAQVEIRALRQNYLPSLYSPREIRTDSEILFESVRAREDAALRFDALTFEGLTYEITSAVPTPDLNVLAADDGRLSPIFESAAQGGLFDGQPRNSQRLQFEDRDDFLDVASLASEDRQILREFAREITVTGSTQFEQALLLESFLRDQSVFTYDASIDPGHSAQNIVDWLLDPDSNNFRTGYCEQFATSMALMARTINIPSRIVLGFAPGTVGADGTITVTQRDAHSWVELWLPSQGWVRFDPTPRSQADNPGLFQDIGFDPFDITPAEIEAGLAGDLTNVSPADTDLSAILERILGAEFTDPGIEIPQVNPDQARTFPWQAAAAGVIMLAVASVPITKLLTRRGRMARLHNGDIGAGWDEIIDRLSDIGAPVSAAATPLEVAAATTPKMLPLAEIYGESIYGPEASPASKSAVTRAELSYDMTRSHIESQYGQLRRTWAWMRPRSRRARSVRRITGANGAAGNGRAGVARPPNGHRTND